MKHGADSVPQYPIGTVAQRTGLSQHVLRAWEKRYGAVAPARDRGGVRLYSNEDIVRLRLLRRVTEAGHAIGRVAALRVGELLALVREDELAGETVEGVRATEAATRFVADCLEAAEVMDGTRIHGTLMRAVLTLSPMEFLEGVTVQLLRRVGELWEEGALCPAHEHLVSVCVQRVLGWMMEALPREPGAPLILAMTPAGQRHELGALLVAVVAADAGWRTLYFGPDLPTRDIAQAVAVTRPDAVAVSIVMESEASALRVMLEELLASLPGKVVLHAGGRGVREHRQMLTELGITWLSDLPSLRIALQTASASPGRR